MQQTQMASHEQIGHLDLQIKGGKVRWKIL